MYVGSFSLWGRGVRFIACDSCTFHRPVIVGLNTLYMFEAF